jgi:hypothetical protein
LTINGFLNSAIHFGGWVEARGLNFVDIGLTEEAVELAALYAEANPQRGRPRRLPSLPAGVVIVSSQRKVRRKLA